MDGCIPQTPAALAHPQRNHGGIRGWGCGAAGAELQIRNKAGLFVRRHRGSPGHSPADFRSSRPSHVITLLRKDHQSPRFATFQVPLRFTKLDLRDYLWNVYNVEVTKVRSLVKQVELARNKRGMKYRPQPLKIMTVEMTRPFVWPEVPEDREAWNHKLWEGREKMIEKSQDAALDEQKGKLPLHSRQPLSKERRKIAELAQALLKGETTWENGVVLDDKWDAVTKAKQVDTREIKANDK